MRPHAVSKSQHRREILQGAALAIFLGLIGALLLGSAA
jgi:hypothetical protein